ncbi:BamA/TamA family outer membrane protein [Candidatus Fermentibacteria bacterium]|nr:BamA/TamA family outer membrane protein [Candidatus Fermentibacteria bacterium]
MPNWWVVQSQNVTIVYPQGSETVAESLMAISEKEIDELGAFFGYIPAHRIPIVLYTSPASFRQTDITTQEIGEAVGGFTEFFKGRVVVPYTGVWSEFRHVVTHELNHALVIDMLYDTSIERIVRSNAPLWTLEGLAEYTSEGWNADAEAEFRDMVISNRMVPIRQLSRRADYIVYTEGQALYHFIATRYGEDKLREFVRNLGASGQLDRVVDNVFNMTVEQLSDKFIEWARETYWSELAWSEGPEDVARPLPGGDQVYQMGTVVSHDGRYVAGVEQHKGNYALTVRSTIDGRVVDRPFEEGGVSDLGISPAYRVCTFSPGGDSLALVYHELGCDRLAVRKIDGDLTDLPVRFDLIRDPSWSPDGRYIAFAALENAQLDVYLWDTSSRTLSRLTETSEGERDLNWTDRGLLASVESASCETCRIMAYRPVGEAEVLFADSAEIRYPVWTNEGLLFLWKREGPADVYLYRPDSGEVVQTTNLYRSIDCLSWAESSKTMVFLSSNWSGGNVFIADGITSRRVSYRPGRTIEVTRPAPSRPNASSDDEGSPADSTRSRPAPRAGPEPPPGGERPPGPRRQGEAGVPRSSYLRISPYSSKLSLDYVNALASFDSFLGLAGYTQFVFSDVLAHHRLYLSVDFNGSVNDADAVASYSYLPMRTDLGTTLFRQTSRYLFKFEDGHTEEVRDVNHGGAAGALYPFSPAFKVEADAGYRRISRVGTWNSDADFRADVFFSSLGLVVDNAKYGYVGPRIGSRLRMGIEAAPGIDGSASYYVASTDLRHYVWVSSNVSLAMRLAGATSWGQDAPEFFLGGAVPHRLIWGEVEELGDLVGFYTNYADILRGYDYAEFNGRRYVCANLEMRVPFVKRMDLGAPLPMTLSNIRGALFVDAGTAFDDVHDWRGAEVDGGYRLRDIKLGFGIGFRLNLGYFVLKEDTAWRTDLRSVSHHPRHYLTLGAEF